MINFTNEFQPSLLELRSILKILRYDWLYRSIKGLSYFTDSSLATFPRAITEEIMSLSLSYNVMLRLFALRQALERLEVVENLLNEQLLNDLIRLGLIKETGNLVQLDNYRIIAWLGFYIISSDPIFEPSATLTSETYKLSYELMKTDAKSAIDLNCGCGLASLVAAEKAEQVFAFSDSLAAINITKANVALNQLSEKIIVSSTPKAEFPKVELIFCSSTRFSLPINIEILLNNKSSNIEKNNLELLNELKNTASDKSKIIIQILATDNINILSANIEKLLLKDNQKVKLFILSQSYIDNEYFKAWAEILYYQLNMLEINSIPLENITNELIEYYKILEAKCSYLILIESNEANNFSFELINLVSELTNQLEIPEDIKLIEQDIKILKTEKGNISIIVDEIQKDIVELIDSENLLLKEVAEIISNRHDLSLETASVKVLELCQELFLSGLLSNPVMSSLRGQMRLMTLNVNKFASTLKTIGEELDKQNN